MEKYQSTRPVPGIIMFDFIIASKQPRIVLQRLIRDLDRSSTSSASPTRADDHSDLSYMHKLSASFN
jgi:hypothetical protein